MHTIAAAGSVVLRDKENQSNLDLSLGHGLVCFSSFFCSFLSGGWVGESWGWEGGMDWIALYVLSLRGLGWGAVLLCPLPLGTPLLCCLFFLTPSRACYLFIFFPSVHSIPSPCSGCMYHARVCLSHPSLFFDPKVRSPP